MQSPYIGNNVGSNWGLPPGFNEMATMPGQIHSQAMQGLSSGLASNISQIMQKYEEGKKTEQTSKALANAIKAIGENEGIDPKFLQAATARYADEDSHGAIVRQQALLANLSQYAHDKNMRSSRGMGRDIMGDLNTWQQSQFGNEPVSSSPLPTNSNTSSANNSALGLVIPDNGLFDTGDPLAAPVVDTNPLY